MMPLRLLGLCAFLLLSGEALSAQPTPPLHIVVGSELDYPPYALTTKDGRADGFSVDLIKAVCDAVEIEISFRVGPWSEVRTALEKGEIDALPLVSYSKEREKVFDFTVPHTKTHGIIFKRRDSPDIQSVSDLRDKQIIVMHSDAGHDWLVRNDISTNLIFTKTVPESLRLLASGNYDYALAPRLVGLLTAKELNLSNVQTTGPLLDTYGRGFGFAVKEGDAALLRLLNEGLNIIKTTGQYDEIYQKWFGTIDPKGIQPQIIIQYLVWGVLGIAIVIGLTTSWSLSLKRKVNKRTHELNNEIVERKRSEVLLKEAKAEAEKANQAKSEFLAAMSHDLRTPLNAIMGFSDMMRQKTFGDLGNPQYEEYANDIHRSGALLVSLINDVLDLSKIEAGKYDLVEEPVSISSLIETSVRQLSPMIETSHQNLSTDIPSDIPDICGDERALIQILNNLISNANKFTPHRGKINVIIKTDDANRILIRVSDTGIGMSKEGIEKALQPFEQADGSHSRRHEGTGLGLHLCLNLMKLFGGTLEIESEINKGTTVTLLFPSERTLSTR